MSVEKDSEAIVYAQVDANLDSNPKIRKAGSFGRQVFEFLLRRNALRGFKGCIPIAFIDADYLADQLMITAADAVTGVTKAVTANLIEISEPLATVRIVGWHESWGRRPKEGKERTAEWRARKRLEQQGQVTSGDDGDETPSQVTSGDDGDETPSQVTSGDESDAREEKRRDQEIHTRVRERPAGAGLIARNVWAHGVKAATALIASKIPVPTWTAMPDATSPAWIALLDRVCELLVSEPTAQAAEAVAKNRIDVAEAKVRAEPNDAHWFNASAMFTPNSFEAFARLDPASFGRKPAKKHNGALGSASPRSDFGDASKPAKEAF